jgi:hypothetical protein
MYQVGRALVRNNINPIKATTMTAKAINQVLANRWSKAKRALVSGILMQSLLISNRINIHWNNSINHALKA